MALGLLFKQLSIQELALEKDFPKKMKKSLPKSRSSDIIIQAGG